MAATQVVSLPRPMPDSAAAAIRSGAGLWNNAVARLRRDRLTLSAIGVLAIMVLLAAAADLLANNFFHYGVTRQDLLDLLHNRPEIAIRMIVVLSRRVREDVHVVGDTAFLDVAGRLANAILRLAGTAGRRDQRGSGHTIVARGAADRPG